MFGGVCLFVFGFCLFWGFWFGLVFLSFFFLLLFAGTKQSCQFCAGLVNSMLMFYCLESLCIKTKDQTTDFTCMWVNF